MTENCSRKDFLAFSLGTLALTFVGCSDDVTSPSDSDGGTSGSGGAGNAGSGGSSAGSSGSSTGGGGGTGGTATGGAGGTGGSGGSAGSAGNGGTGGSTGGSAGGGAGGASAGAGGGGGSGGGGGAECTGEITALCSRSNGMTDGHTHVLKIPLADIMAGVAKSFDSELNGAMQVPGGDHCHRIELTAEDFTTLKNGGVVKKPTCNGGDHEFVLSCGEDPPEPVNPSSCPGGDNAGTCG